MLDKKRKFIFSCEDCGTILSAEFEEKEEIDKVIEIVPPIIKELRTLSPYGKEKIIRCS